MSGATETKPGRKPKSPEERRSMTFRIRLTKGEWDAIFRAAETTGETMAGLIRRSVLDEACRIDHVATKLAQHQSGSGGEG